MIDLSSREGIEKSIETVDKALNATLGMATDIGAAQQGLMASEENYTTMGESLTASLSTEDDTDIAAEVTKLRSAETQNQLALHAQKNVFAQ
jgi:flagellin